MNRATLQTFKVHWGEEEKQTQRELTRLSPEEAKLYNVSRDQSLRKKLRLKQERGSFGWLESALKALR